MRLADVLAVLRAVAPEHLAESWDRVGLHLGSERQRVRRALLCIDLTEPVMAEAVAQRCELIVAYHPLIFDPLRRLTDQTWKERVVLEAARRRVAVYSPHTALDNVPGGMTDWLCDGLGKHSARFAIAGHADGNAPAQSSQATGGAARAAGDGAVAGAGRVHHLARPVSAATLVERVKRRLGLAHVKVAAPIAGDPRRDSPVAGKFQSIAVCPGAGGSLFERARADAYFTGEMQHHQVLDMSARGQLVILAGHTHTERPYLPAYRDRLVAAGADRIEWLVSAADRAPFAIR